MRSARTVVKMGSMGGLYRNKAHHQIASIAIYLMCLPDGGGIKVLTKIRWVERAAGPSIN